MGKLLLFPERSSSIQAQTPEAVEANVSYEQSEQEISTSGASAHAIVLMEEAAELLESLGGAEREAGWILDDLVRMLSGKASIVGTR